MNCNCTKACSIPYCITELEIGLVEPGLTDLILEIRDTITGRVKKISGLSPQADGLLIVDVEEIAAFFSPNFVYEIRVLYSDESGCEVVPVTVGDQIVDCFTVEFIDGIATRGVLSLVGQNVQYITVYHTRGETSFTNKLNFSPSFDGSLIMYWGDESQGRVYSDTINSHTYSTPGDKVSRLRGDLSNLTIWASVGMNITNFILPTGSGVINLDLESNSLPSDVVNNILINLDSAGLENGEVLLTQTVSAPPTGAGIIAKTNLQNKGWTVTTD